VLVRIDQRRQRDRRLDRRIEPQAHFAQERKVRTEAGRDHQFIREDVPRATAGAGGRPQLFPVQFDRSDWKAGFDLHLSGCDQRSEMRAQFAARGELIVGAAAEGLRRVIAAQQPYDAGAGRLLG
jgi:hypothetical protein